VTESRICAGFRVMRQLALISPESLQCSPDLPQGGIVWALQQGLIAQKRDRLYITSEGRQSLAAATDGAVCDEQEWVSRKRACQDSHKGRAACPTYGKARGRESDIEQIMEIARFAARVGVHRDLVLDAIAAGIVRVCEDCGAIRMSVSGGCSCNHEGNNGKRPD
jgi:hypothetical protein